MIRGNKETLKIYGETPTQNTLLTEFNRMRSTLSLHFDIFDYFPIRVYSSS